LVIWYAPKPGRDSRTATELTMTIEPPVAAGTSFTLRDGGGGTSPAQPARWKMRPVPAGVNLSGGPPWEDA
jgi:hypothetical protein